MKKSGIYNAELSKIVAASGHGDRIIICDVGLPIPKNATKVDLALSKNNPRFLDTLKIVLEELAVESAVIAEEMLSINPDIHAGIKDLLPDMDIKKISHEKFKAEYRDNQETVFVRTGETSPYANISLISGVTF